VVWNRFTQRTALAHFEMRGRLIARQPAQDHRFNHALAKIVGKTHPRRPILSANTQAR
jgi:hypothetical protein